MCDSRVVLYFPEALAETFPFGGFSKLLLTLFVGEQILGPQKSPDIVEGTKSLENNCILNLGDVPRPLR